MSRYLNIFITAILIFAIYGAGSLSIDQWKSGGICPIILGIPACYIVLLLFLNGLLSHLLKFKFTHAAFFTSIGIVGLIASIGTTGELLGFAECPKTSSGIPMCFISFSVCLSLLTLKFIELKEILNIK